MSRRSSWVVLLSALASAGCGQEPLSCPTDMRSSLRGEVRDRAGNPITPDRVERTGLNGRNLPCDVRPGGYSCPESGSGRARVTVSVAGATWTQSILIHRDETGCHDELQTLDFTLPELTPCAPRDAVRGTLVDAGGEPNSYPTLHLRRVDDRDDHPDQPLVACVIENASYRCPAISYYSDAEYELLLDFGDAGSTKISVQAQDCRVETAQHDIDLRRVPGAGG